MKKLYTLIVIFFAFQFYLIAQPQFAVVAYNGSTGDGLSLVALVDVPGNTTVYITENEYSATFNNFNSGESVVSYTTPGSVTPKGHVITFTETGTSTNTFGLDCTAGSGNCGTVTTHQTPISYASGSSEYVYVYTDSDNNPQNGITEIYGVIVSQLFIGGTDNDPTGDFPNAILVEGFPSGSDHREFMVGLRSSTVTKADLIDPSNYNVSSGNTNLSEVQFVNITLPVKLVRFQARAVSDNLVFLNWSTISEINNDRFEIERSFDGKSFEKIGERRGKSYSFTQVDYTFSDINPGSEINYYRLKQIDFDGSYAYSDIVQVDMSKEVKKISVGPNPFTEYVDIKSPGGFENGVSVQILDVAGQVVYKNTFDDQSSTISISLQDLNPGNYYLKVQTGLQEIVEKLVKI